MAVFWMDPNYESLFHDYSLVRYEDFLLCKKARVFRRHTKSGRSVAVLRIGRFTAYLKREYRISYKEKLRNWWDGFGAVGKSLREWQMFGQARQAGFVVPEPLACGQDARTAFLLTAELEDFVPLDDYVQVASERELTSLMRRLARWLARWHVAGFAHPDLYAWHVFVRVSDQRLAVLDLARGNRLDSVPWPERLRELAWLGATLPTTISSSFSWGVLLDSYLATVSEWEAGAAGLDYALARQAAFGFMERWAHLVRRRRDEEKACRIVLDRELGVE